MIVRAIQANYMLNVRQWLKDYSVKKFSIGTCKIVLRKDT